MTMSRQDFELIARVLSDARNIGGGGELGRHGIAHAFASELARLNPRFDRARFLKACGVES